MSVSIADEIQISRIGRVHGCLQRAFAWVRDWTGRQARMQVGVVLRIESHIVVMKCAAVCALQQLCVNHTGIGLQSYAVGQAICRI